MPSTISQAARDEATRRKRRSRPRVLEDLATVVRHRGGAITADQIHVIASVLAHLEDIQALPEAVAAWLNGVGVADDVIAAWLASPTWHRVLKRAAAADRGETRAYRSPRTGAVERRPPQHDYSIPRIVGVFAVTADEEMTLDLATVVSKRRAAELARRMEGIMPAPKPQPEQQARTGPSKATHYRRLAKRAADRVRQCTALALKQAGPTGVRLAACLSISIEEAPEPKALVESLIRDRHAGCLTPARHPNRALFRDGPAEVRRLYALGERLRLTVDDYARHDQPRTWYVDDPPHRRLTAEEWKEVAAAVDAAEHGLARHEAVTRARSQAFRAAHPDHPTASAPRDPKARPARVSPAAWAAVPERLRPRAVCYAGRFFLGEDRDTPDIAMALGTAQAAREATIVAACLEAVPTANPAYLERFAMQPHRDEERLFALPPVDAEVEQLLRQLEADTAVHNAAARAVRRAIALEPDLLAPDAGLRRSIVRDATLTVVVEPTLPPATAVRRARHRLEYQSRQAARPANIDAAVAAVRAVMEADASVSEADRTRICEIAASLMVDRKEPLEDAVAWGKIELEMRKKQSITYGDPVMNKKKYLRNI